MKIRGQIIGEEDLQAALRRTKRATTLRLRGATEQTAKLMVARARARLQPGHGFRFGYLKAALGYEMKRGAVAIVGIRRGVSPAGFEPGNYAHLVEFGHAGPRPAPAKPFMLPAAEAVRPDYLNLCRQAGKEIERDAATVGGGFL